MKKYKYNHCSISRIGKKDGRDWKWKLWLFSKEKKNPQPKIDEVDIPEFEKELIRQGYEELDGLSHKWSDLDHKLKPLYCGSQKEYFNAQESYKKESKEAEEKLQPLNKTREAFNNLVVPRFSEKWALFWLIIIGIIEFPLNSQIFQIFGENKIMTYLFSAGICIILPIASHFLGAKLKNEKKSKRDNIFMIGTPVFILLLIGGIALLRETFFEVTQANSILKINISSEALTILFIIINLTIFFIATFISYESAHKDKDEFYLKEKQYKVALKLYTKELKEAILSEKILSNKEKEYYKIKNQREKEFEKFCEIAKNKKSIILWAMQVYRVANMNQRNEKPECFKVAVKVPDDFIPLTLKKENLDCNCNEETSGSKTSFNIN